MFPAMRKIILFMLLVLVLEPTFAQRRESTSWFVKDYDEQIIKKHLDITSIM